MILMSISLSRYRGQWSYAAYQPNTRARLKRQDRSLYRLIDLCRLLLSLGFDERRGDDDA